ncbi:hypothetical protein TVAG_057170 [Trichomonas vaginalis G3]|uniref:Right handed beta helix domain-containing protein n=1 Tax=Trichomonas vaginalis (strain ATCC PRA-98 / G3) TaxID=412133 RepID=A2EKC5_TRIV3|nr:hypothetical protein TVAGG3_0772540 [Trichomonas vaginalis G3]EAY06923.1 hypothetical protein TVAG_057170 [Trichomonas vaginalis G3]KAI5513912.1 hypothetical protein TVAGG3_0772540 [Trichomonas vaginalis G3]|eukprot:XP_001319146.1 hypothetical protein [Trichomonas vaginalis G3]
MQFQRSFSEYYPLIEPNSKSNNETISGTGNYYIHHAIFSFHYRNTAISLDSKSKVLLETCTFYNNSSTQSGGSIYIKESECVLIHICISLSSTILDYNWGCAYYIQSVENSNNKNYAFECSVSKCNGRYASLCHEYGFIQISNMNTSYHKIPRVAAYGITETEGTIIVKFATASNTTSSEYCGIAHFARTVTITKCNYLSNVCKGSDSVIINCYYFSICTYSNCSFIDNKGNYLFSSKPNIVDNCYFNENNFTQTVRGYSTFKSIKSLDLFISHYSTYFCSAINLEYNNPYKKYEKEELNLEDIKNIVNKVYNTSFVEAVNLSM